MKKLLCVLLALCLTLSLRALPVAAEEAASVKEGAIAGIRNFEDGDFFISEEVAGYIAELFIADMVETGLTVWDEDTAVVATVPMYDETGENVTAYSVEATEGYVVVSAYLDMPDIIFEWSDETAPLYSKFKTTAPSPFHRAKSDTKIVYVGALGYYYDDGGETLLSIDETEVQRSSIGNSLEGLRNPENGIPEVQKSIVEIKAENVEASAGTVDRSSVIMIKDPFALLKVVTYSGSSKCGVWKGLCSHCNHKYLEADRRKIREQPSDNFGIACISSELQLQKGALWQNRRRVPFVIIPPIPCIQFPERTRRKGGWLWPFRIGKFWPELLSARREAREIPVCRPWPAWS